jgi:hypothetical protein
MISADTLNPQYLKTKTGRPSFVVLPIKEYENLIEDYNDLTIMNEREHEPRISLSTLKKNLSTAECV